MDMGGICGIFLPLLGPLLGQLRQQLTWYLHQGRVALIEAGFCECQMAVLGR